MTVAEIECLCISAAGSPARSQCTLACKWTYLAHEAPGWQREFFAAVGLVSGVHYKPKPEHFSMIY